MEIIILHGWATETDKWNLFLKELSDKGFKPNLLKIPGLTEKINRVWDLDDYVDWLKKKIGNKIAILLSHSNGGRIALAFANKYPKNVKNLILIDSAGIYHNELSLRLKRFIFRNIAKVGKRISRSETLRKLIYKIAREGDYSHATPSQRKTMLNLINTDLSEIIKKVKVLTLIIWGGEDKVTPLSDGRLIHSLIKNSKLKIIRGARHSPQFTNPEEVAKIINEYL